MARLGEALRLEKEQLARELAPLEVEERALNTALDLLGRLSEARQLLVKSEKARDVTRANVSAHEREAARQHDNVARLRGDLARAQTMGAVRRFLSGLSPEALERQIAAAERAAQIAADAAGALLAELQDVERQITALRNKIDDLVQETQHYPAAPEIQTRLTALRGRIGPIRNRMTAIERELAELEQQVVAHCRVLATTVYRTYLGKSAPRQFDAVVIDEASMLMPPLVFYAAGLAKRSVTVAGDFRQLPPIVVSQEPPAEEWLKRDIFEIAHIPERLKQGEATPYLVALQTQYRMCDPICAVVNDLFYSDHPLRSGPNVNRHGCDFPLGSAPLFYVDTAPFHPWTALRIGSFSRYNLFHALLVRNIVLHLAETEFLPPAGKPNEMVGVVAPYSSQARLIQALLEDRLGPSRIAGIAATVHRFQGNEKSAMMIDLTDSFGAPLGRFLRATHIEEDGARLLNVAMSRAKHHVVLVGNFDYLRSRAPGNGFVQRLLDHFERQGAALNLDALLPLAERDWLDGLHRVLPATFDFPNDVAGAFTEGTFYPAFQKDLARAGRSIVIFSPFATSPGTARWIDLLRMALHRGTQVRIVTRPPEEAGGGTTNEVTELVRKLRELGVTVDLRRRMHEKFAIIDDHILWHGSLNILSHRDTHESMLRLPGRAACSLMARFNSTPASRRDEPRPLHAAENPACPVCDGAMIWNSGRYGIYFECEDSGCNGKLDTRSRSQPRAPVLRTPGVDKQGPPQTDRGRPRAARPCPQPGCDGRLRERTGRRGRFLGCSNYPACRYTENLS